MIYNILWIVIEIENNAGNKIVLFVRCYVCEPEYIIARRFVIFFSLRSFAHLRRYLMIVFIWRIQIQIWLSISFSVFAPRKKFPEEKGATKLKL